MFRALLTTFATAAASAAAYRLYKQGKFDGLIARLPESVRTPLLSPALAGRAYEGDNVSKPAPAHPWPVDPKAIRSSPEVPDAA